MTSKIFSTPFALSGDKASIPEGTQPSGSVSYNEGFGFDYEREIDVDPLAKDIDRTNFNSMLFEITNYLRDIQSGIVTPYNATISTAIGGYPIGARVARTDGTGLWINTVDANTTDPESVGATGWRAEIDAGVTTVALSNSAVVLSNAQAESNVILLVGVLTADVDLVMPQWIGSQWVVDNATTGSFNVSVRAPAGFGVTVAQGVAEVVYCTTGAISKTGVTPSPANMPSGSGFAFFMGQVT